MKNHLFNHITLSLAVALISVPALAAKPGGTSSRLTGNDISYPQCGKSVPTGQAFGIVGVNGGIASTSNPCLEEQLIWAAQSTGIAGQPRVQVYVNTANPGQHTPLPSTWPTNNQDPISGQTIEQNPGGTCDGSTTSDACSWQYGWNRAAVDVHTFFLPAAGNVNPADYVWWLDVETANSWQTDQHLNALTLEGMVAYFYSLAPPSAGGETTVGIYSTSSMWSQIVGTIGSNSSLNGLINWRPGARSLSAAKSNCSLPSLTGGKVVITQYISRSFDYDYACP